MNDSLENVNNKICLNVEIIKSLCENSKLISNERKIKLNTDFLKVVYKKWTDLENVKNILVTAVTLSDI